MRVKAELARVQREAPHRTDHLGTNQPSNDFFTAFAILLFGGKKQRRMLLDPRGEVFQNGGFKRERQSGG